MRRMRRRNVGCAARRRMPRSRLIVDGRRAGDGDRGNNGKVFGVVLLSKKLFQTSSRASPFSFQVRWGWTFLFPPFNNRSRNRFVISKKTPSRVPTFAEGSPAQRNTDQLHRGDLAILACLGPVQAVFRMETVVEPVILEDPVVRNPEPTTSSTTRGTHRAERRRK